MEKKRVEEGVEPPKPEMQDLSLPFDEIAVLGPSFFVFAFLLLFGSFIAFHGFTPILKVDMMVIGLGIIPAGVLGIILHELIHGICFAYLSGYNFSIVRFGFDKKTFTPYAHCKLPINAFSYKISLLMPGILVGLVPAIYAIVVGNVPWLLFGFFFTLGAAGDAIIFALIYRVGNQTLLEDHPSRAGCFMHSTSKPDTDLADNWLAFSKRHYKTLRMIVFVILFSFFVLMGYRLTNLALGWF